MCGIFGYYQFNVQRERRAIMQLLVTGLRRLEYRGYDSAGLCIDSTPLPPPLASPPSEGFQRRRSDDHVDGPPPLIVKASGKIAVLEKEVADSVRANACESWDLACTSSSFNRLLLPSVYLKTIERHLQEHLFPFL